MTEFVTQCAGIIPLRKGKGGYEVLLLLHRSGSYWGFPKGHIEEEEDVLEAAKREFQEETGLCIEKIIQEKTFIEEYNFEKNGKRVYKIVYYFPAFVNGEIKLSQNEILEAVWLPISEALEKLSFPEGKKVCKEVNQLLSMI